MVDRFCEYLVASHLVMKLAAKIARMLLSKQPLNAQGNGLCKRAALEPVLINAIRNNSSVTCKALNPDYSDRLLAAKLSLNGSWQVLSLRHICPLKTQTQKEDQLIV